MKERGYLCEDCHWTFVASDLIWTPPMGWMCKECRSELTINGVKVAQ